MHEHQCYGIVTNDIMRILWIPHTGWHIPQRAHIFCRALAKRHEVHVTNWVADFHTIKDYLSWRYIRNYTYRYAQDGLIHVHTIPRISPAIFFASLRRLNQALFARYVRRIIAHYRIDAVVGTFVVPPPKAPRLIFDLFDDNVAYWRQYGIVKAYADEIAQVEAAYIKTADAIVAASSVLVEQARARQPHGSVYWIPNGVDLAQFQAGDGTIWKQKLGIKGKLVGVVGNQDKSTELDKVLFAAEALQHEPVTFLIAGRGTAMPAAQATALAKGLSNIHFAGFINPDQLPHLMRSLDVGLCPYPKTDGADASSPMRLINYSATGTPVVCTDLLSVRALGWPNVVLVDDSPAALVEGIKVALTMPATIPVDIDKFDLANIVPQYEAVLENS